MNDEFRKVKIQDKGTMKEDDSPQQLGENPVNSDWWHKYVDESQLPAAEQEEEVPVPVWKKVLAFRPTRRQVIAVSALTLMLLIANIYAGMASEIGRLESKVTEQEHFESDLQMKTAELGESEQKLSLIKEQLAAEKRTVEEKKQELAQRKSLFDKHKVEAAAEIDHWKKPMSKVLGAVMDVYSMKLEARDPVFSEFEDTEGRDKYIQARWEELADELSLYEEYREEEALLRVRLLESYAEAGQWEKISPDKIDWTASGLEERRSDILSKVYFSMAMDQFANGARDMGQKSLQLCKQYTVQVKDDDLNALYTKSMIHLLEGRSMVADDPVKAMKSYQTAISGLDEVVAKLPASVMVRSEFAKACRDGAMISAEGNDVAWAEQLQKKARENAAWLVKKHPEVKLPHLMYAELDIAEAEEYVRQGRGAEVEPLLKRAEKSISAAGGDVLLQSAITGVRAFVLWDKGYITKAKEEVLTEIRKVGKVVNSQPRDIEARYRLSSLLWERSAMHADSSEALREALAAAEQLKVLLKNGAGAREASVRRMAALVLSDAGHLSVEKGDKKQAKQCFDEALHHWKYLRGKWGDCEEYREGERWCAHKIKRL